MKKGTKQILLIGCLGVGGYFAYTWWQGRQAVEAEAAGYWPSYGAGGGGIGGGFGFDLFGQDVVSQVPCGVNNDGVVEEEPTFTAQGEKIVATGTTPMGSKYQILESGESLIFSPYTQTWDPIAYPGPAFIKEPGPAPYGELSAELIRQIQYGTTGIPARGLAPAVPAARGSGVPSFEPTGTPGLFGGLTGRTPMGTAYRLESLARGAPSHIYNPYTANKYGLGGWEKIAYPGPAVVKQPGLRPIGEPSAQAARAASAARAAAMTAATGPGLTQAQRVAATQRTAARAAAAKAQAAVGSARAAAGLVAYPAFAPSRAAGYGVMEPSAQIAKAVAAGRPIAREGAGHVAYPTFAPSTASQEIQARVAMAGGGHL